jgi:hypothetical protein
VIDIPGRRGYPEGSYGHLEITGALDNDLRGRARCFCKCRVCGKESVQLYYEVIHHETEPCERCGTEKS